MPVPLSELERRVLDYLIEYLRRNTYQPSIREIGREFSIKSTKTVSELLQSLADKGWIERDPSRSRGVRLHGIELGADAVEIPVLRDADGSVVDQYTLDRRFTGGAGVFLIVMRGNHLREEGIWEGDLLLVEPVTPDAVETGDIVLVRHARGTDVRRCGRSLGEVVLEPTDTDPDSVTLTGRHLTAIQGRVGGVVRRLRPVPVHAPSETVAVAS